MWHLLGEFEDREEALLWTIVLLIARCAVQGHTEILTNGLRSTDNLIL